MSTNQTDTDESGIKQPSFEYPTERSFQNLEKALMRMAIVGTELRYPKNSDRDEEIDALTESIVSDIKELERRMADARGFDEAHQSAIRAGAFDEVFES